MKECLYNTYSDNIAGYCKLHHCSMTAKQMKAKGCLQKQCWHLEKNEEHPYWRQRASMKQKRKDRKLAIDNYVYAVSGGIV